VPAIGCQWFSTFLDANIYSRMIAPARTFCIFEEVYLYMSLFCFISGFLYVHCFSPSGVVHIRSSYVLLTCFGNYLDLYLLEKISFNAA
jgi:hypothetical protein